MLLFKFAQTKLQKAWKVRRHLKIELCTFFLFVPGFLQMIGISIFELEKACRVNLAIESEVCDNLNNVPYKEICTLLEENSLELGTLNNTSIDYFIEKLKIVERSGKIINGKIELILIEKVCSAEKESQKLVSKLFAIRAPIATVFVLIIVSFAGAWSDKHDVRKAFILIPFVGELLAVLVYIVSAIYMDEIRVEYAIMAGKIVPSMFGGQTLFMIGVSSFMTVTTAENYRTFRFGCFSMFITLLGMFASPLSGILYNTFSYVGKIRFYIFYITRNQ